MKVTMKVEGLDELVKTLKKMGGAPQKFVTPAAKKAMQIPFKKAKDTAPYLTGNLEEGLKLEAEKSKGKGRKVYRIIFDPNKSDIFLSKNAEGKVVGHYGYAQERGFFKRDGTYMPGLFFIQDSFNESVDQVARTIITEMGKQIEKASK